MPLPCTCRKALAPLGIKLTRLARGLPVGGDLNMLTRTPCCVRSKEDLENLNILFVGSPTRAFRPTPATMTFIKGLGTKCFVRCKRAAFDTRIPFDQAESGFLNF
jgi:hypothetical protein